MFSSPGRQRTEPGVYQLVGPSVGDSPCPRARCGICGPPLFPPCFRALSYMKKRAPRPSRLRPTAMSLGGMSGFFLARSLLYGSIG